MIFNKETVMEAGSATFGLVVRFTVRPGAEAEFDALIKRTVALIRTQEPGTLIYNCHHVDGAARQWIFYELYRDRAAFDAHEQQDHVKRFLTEREPLLESKEVRFLKPGYTTVDMAA
jgi:quinol monooxygenase YgiN